MLEKFHYKRFFLKVSSHVYGVQTGDLAGVDKPYVPALLGRLVYKIRSPAVVEEVEFAHVAPTFLKFIGVSSNSAITI
jgi:hypothetical protein